MKPNIAFKKLTTLIAALYAVLNVLVTFPVAHEHHHVHHCDCRHSIGHWHSSESDSDDSACAACQILAVSVLAESAFVLLYFDVAIVGVASHNIATSAEVFVASARAPPVC